MLKTPPFLQAGDQVVIIAPGKQFERDDLQPAIETLREWGLEVHAGENAYKKSGLFAGTDQQRALDLQNALDNPEIKAVFCARGGYGTSRIIDEIRFKTVKKNPKWVIGFSDITILLSQLQKKKIQCVHGPMPLTFHKKGGKDSLENLRKFLMGEQDPYIIGDGNEHNRKGIATAPLTGGNLSILCSQLDTASDISWNDRILFIEEVAEPLYKLDRMMVQLKRSNRLKKIKGLVVGQLTDITDGAPSFKKSAEEIIKDAVADYDYPVCFNFPAGHEANNQPLIFGRMATLRVNQKRFELQYQ